MDNSINFGKRIISILTSGMYKHPEFLFREYIQNAADQIDKDRDQPDADPRICIYIDKRSREIRIEDRATGIPGKDVFRILGNIAASEKKAGTDKGLFGIGRLGGLSYCETLIFETSYRGEDFASVMRWDAKTLLNRVASEEDNENASTIIQSCITSSQKSENINAHYFKVILKNVYERFSELLDKDKVTGYLRMTAPVKIDDAKFTDYGKVREFLKDNNLPEPSSYNVYLNDDEIRKPYHRFTDAPLRTDKQKIKDIKCELFKNEEGKIQAWAWVGLRDFSEGTSIIKQDCIFRSIRLRLHNIQIGGEDALTQLYHEDKAAKYFVGEIHVLDSTLTPNARRDYFELTPEFRAFENQVKIFLDSLMASVRNASKVSSIKKRIKQNNEVLDSYRAKEARGFIDKHEKEEWEKKRQAAEVQREREIQAYRKLVPENKEYQSVGLQSSTGSIKIEEDANQTQGKENKKTRERIPLVTDNLHGYKKSEKKIVSKILAIIQRSLKDNPDKYTEIENLIIKTLNK